MSEVTVYLSPEDAELFKKFRQWQDNWVILEPALLDKTVRKITILLDENNVIHVIDTQQRRFTR